MVWDVADWPVICLVHLYNWSSSSHMCVTNHKWSATKQRLHLQSVAEISHHSVLSGDRIRQCETSSGSCHKDTDQCLYVAISFCRHRSVPVPCGNGSAETTVAEGGRNPVARLWGHTLYNWLHLFECVGWCLGAGISNLSCSDVFTQPSSSTGQLIHDITAQHSCHS